MVNSYRHQLSVWMMTTWGAVGILGSSPAYTIDISTDTKSERKVTPRGKKRFLLICNVLELLHMMTSKCVWLSWHLSHGVDGAPGCWELPWKASPKCCERSPRSRTKSRSSAGSCGRRVTNNAGLE
ncbi:hypothetical protein BDD12DRAFT_846238 [Trichophaea hybrida]|nr:hypothetical protein BDD12DRAFT_846238 [Trichophaea hybrida]